MAWRGKYRKIDPESDPEAARAGIVGVVAQVSDGQITHETTVPEEFIEDDGRPFENDEEVEFVVRRVKEKQ